MQVRYAVDMTVPGRFGPDGEGDLHIRITKLMKKLHGAFTALGKRFAIDLPMYGRASSMSVIRVFAESREELEALVAQISDRCAQLKVSVGAPREIPEGFDGKWVFCRRFRIPSRKKEAGLDKSFRAARMQAAEQNRMAHFTVRSASNGHSYRVYVLREEVEPSAGHRDGVVDGYGLSNVDAPVLLPVL